MHHRDDPQVRLSTAEVMSVPFLDSEARREVLEEEALIVREIIGNVAEGSTVYREAKRLNDLGIPSPGSLYGTSQRKLGRSWSATTISKIVHQPAYSGSTR